MKLRLLLATLILSLVAAACGGAGEVASDIAEETVDVVEQAVEDTIEENTGDESADEEEADEEESTESEEAMEDEEGAEATEINGMEIYEANCSRCHASDGSGGRGPNLQGIAEEQPDQTAGIQQTIDGGRGMPAFGERLSAEEIQATIDYIWDTF